MHRMNKKKTDASEIATIARRLGIAPADESWSVSPPDLSRDTEAAVVSREPTRARLRLARTSDEDPANRAIERRRGYRFKVEWDATVRGKDINGSAFTAEAELENLSSHGAFLYTAIRVKPGLKLDLNIQLPVVPERWMQYSAEVVRIEDRTTGLGVALKFSSIRPRVVA